MNKVTDKWSILKDPINEQFRLFKKTDAAIQGKLLCLQPDGAILRLIEELGYCLRDPFDGDKIELQNGQKQITELLRYLEMPIYEKQKYKGEKLVTKSVADFKKGSIKYELFEENMKEALRLYNQSVASRKYQNEKAVG